ncbi:hypothetical protein BDV95DRAFT_627863 [Massariosphaeria phaeospora]|uniref:Uncharacterized protein n=1 Tax=Massariosphaeria phaeospora TaxID=100035 RepID=A0A7C8I867_9PLEO|nr:hypothetical protein BDV95DRAFT_627863 [Massariosphaeria phaeospora]
MDSTIHSLTPDLQLFPVILVQPFPLMKLPLNIRNRIYSLLLTVPAMICMSVDGTKFNMSMFRFTNIALLRVSKKVYFETKAIMYSTNIFDIVPPSTELSPSTDYRVCLFPRGCQGLVQKLTIRVRSLYMLQYLMNGAYAHIKNAYRGLQKLTLILELETTTRGFGKLWAKNEGEASDVYVHRLHAKMSAELYGYRGTPKTIPTWITLRVLFDGERYDEVSEPANGAQIGNQASDNDPDEDEAEDARRADLKKGVFQAFEMFKKGAR